MKVKIKGFMHYASGSKTDVTFCSVDMSAYGYVVIAPYEIEVDFDIPEGFNPIQSAVDGLKGQIAAADRAHAATVNKLQQKINDLLCLEFQPVEVMA